MKLVKFEWDISKGFCISLKYHPSHPNQCLSPYDLMILSKVKDELIVFFERHFLYPLPSLNKGKKGKAHVQSFIVEINEKI
jgi:hypothetical protein